MYTFNIYFLVYFNVSDGKKIHLAFMGKEKTIQGTRLRVDGLNETTMTIYELKPYYIPGARKAVKQIINYNNKLDGGYENVIVLYLFLGNEHLNMTNI